VTAFACPNTPRCAHPGFVHDVHTLDDPEPQCCAEGCDCGSQRQRPDCPNCNDTGHACEDHPTMAWGGMCCDPDPVRCDHGACHCGTAGMPCPTCCDPEDGTHSIVAAFTPTSEPPRS
jgi:hypothetical protein